MTIRLSYLTPTWRGQSTARVGLPLALGTVAACWCVVHQQTTQNDDMSSASKVDEPLSYQINVNFIDRLASKAYLHFSSSQETIRKMRPVGVPETLRILTVDLPEVSRQGFKDGHCSLDTRRIYPDGIATPEIIDVQKGRGHVSVPVEQKAWIKSMVRCMADGSPDKVSVEVMQADVGRMNPSNIRRIHQYGTLRYDPGKYAVTSPRTDRREDRKQQPRRRNSLRDSEEIRVVNEIQAPWHQQAWREEALLRISGQVRFGETMQEADKWTKRIYGYQFRSTVPSSSRSWLDMIFFWRSEKLDEGVDGSPVPNATSNRPHAVIANGLALQMVPNSLRVLQKLCAEHNVPLFVIRDPRSWGGNTHPDDLGQVLKDVQKTVKSRIVTRSLQHAAGTAFTRGRMLGRLETDAKWQAKDALRRSKDITNRAMDNFRKHQDSDWSNLNEDDLEKRLAEYGLIRTVTNEDGESSRKELAEALGKIALRYGTSETIMDDKVEEDTNPSNATKLS